MAIKKFQTTCCAMCILSAGNEDSIEDLQKLIDRTKKESEKKWSVYDRESGERAIQIVTTPYEAELEGNLKKLGFKEIAKINRRNGYPQVGKLKLHMLSW